MNPLWKILLIGLGVASATVLSDKSKEQEQIKSKKTDSFLKKQKKPQEPTPQEINSVLKKQEPISPKKDILPKELVYMPDMTEFQSMKVPALRITSKQAIQQGFSFRKKSKSIRITNYHGSSENLLIPAFIDNLKVNEIGQNAFYQNQIIKKIQIPSTIRKIGKNAFRESQLQTCIFADGLQSIPETCFFGCQELSEIHLPKTLIYIGNSAMASCKKLNYIQFPPYLYKLEDYAFRDSGLNGFGNSGRYLVISNGLAFHFTPLQEHYALILGRKFPYYNDELLYSRNYHEHINVLLVGNKTRDFSFLENKFINLLKNSVLGSYLGFYSKLSYSLDLHKCRSVSINRDSFWIRYDKNGVPENHIYIDLPKNKFSYRLPAGVFGYNGTKEQPIKNFEYKQTNDNLITLTIDTTAIRDIYVGEICLSKYKTLKIENTSSRYATLCIHENAIRIFDIPEIELGKKIQATGAIFSGLCSGLHKISWLEHQEIIIKYIPSAELVGESIHKDLLKAFVPIGESYFKLFFDSKLVETIFSHHAFIHTRQRVLIAIDMLRSTQRPCDSSIKIYE
ncbi:MAG: leucine-rich repeat domain-containing protein, partial [Oscillospiraceae bacterium]|nr:leucine-rich repeat domain-containing protein [Oscillospiraceae bacterium]